MGARQRSGRQGVLDLVGRRWLDVAQGAELLRMGGAVVQERTVDEQVLDTRTVDVGRITLTS